MVLAASELGEQQVVQRGDQVIVLLLGGGVITGGVEGQSDEVVSGVQLVIETHVEVTQRVSVDLLVSAEYYGVVVLLTDEPDGVEGCFHVSADLNVVEVLEYGEEADGGPASDPLEMVVQVQLLVAVETVGAGLATQEQVDQFLGAVGVLADEELVRVVHLLLH